MIEANQRETNQGGGRGSTINSLNVVTAAFIGGVVVGTLATHALAPAPALKASFIPAVPEEMELFQMTTETMALLAEKTAVLAEKTAVPAEKFELEDYAGTYRETRNAYLKTANELKLATGPYKAARDAYVAADATYTKSLYE